MEENPVKRVRKQVDFGSDSAPKSSRFPRRRKASSDSLRPHHQKLLSHTAKRAIKIFECRAVAGQILENEFNFLRTAKADQATKHSIKPLARKARLCNKADKLPAKI